MSKIKVIRSGGQSGVDQASLDTAIRNNIAICGWCPKGGWSENIEDVRTIYPQLMETHSADIGQRTRQNVLDSDATIVILPSGIESKGTNLAIQTAKQSEKPYIVLQSKEDIMDATLWLNSLPNELDINVAGAKESECKGIYNETVFIINEVIRSVEGGK